MSDADPGHHSPSPPWPEEAPPFTPPAPPPPEPGDVTQVAGGPGVTGGPDPLAGGPAGGGQAGPPPAPPHSGGLMPAAVKGLHWAGEQAEHLLERPGSFAAWAIVLAVAIYWLSSIIGGFAHGITFRDTFNHTVSYSGLSARQRLDSFVGVGNYDMAFALLLALGLALLVPTKDEREAAGIRRSGGPSQAGPPAASTAVDPGGLQRDGRASQLLLLVLTLAGLVVALAALVQFISDLSRAGSQPDLSVQGAIQDLAAIPPALVVALWAASRVSEWPAWARIAPFTPADGAQRGGPASGVFARGNRPRAAAGPDLAGPPPSPPGSAPGLPGNGPGSPASSTTGAGPAPGSPPPGPEVRDR